MTYYYNNEKGLYYTLEQEITLAEKRAEFKAISTCFSRFRQFWVLP